MVLVAAPSARLVHAYGSRFTLLAGYLFVLLSFLTMLLLWKKGSPYWQVGLGYALLGIGVGLFGTPASSPPSSGSLLCSSCSLTKTTSSGCSANTTNGLQPAHGGPGSSGSGRIRGSAPSAMLEELHSEVRPEHRPAVEEELARQGAGSRLRGKRCDGYFDRRQGSAGSNSSAVANRRASARSDRALTSSARPLSRLGQNGECREEFS